MALLSDDSRHLFYGPLLGLDEGASFHGWQECLGGGFVLDAPL